MECSKLRGAIRAEYGTQKAFARAMGINTSTLSHKLCGRTEWTHGEIAKACSLLGIPLEEAYIYFF